MEIPKYIEQLIQRREKLANKLNEVSAELGDWLKRIIYHLVKIIHYRVV